MTLTATLGLALPRTGGDDKGASAPAGCPGAPWACRSPSAPRSRVTSATAARLAGELVPALSLAAVTRVDGEGSARVHTVAGAEGARAAEVDGLGEISWWILGYGDQVRVVAPQELRERIVGVVYLKTSHLTCMKANSEL